VGGPKTVSHREKHWSDYRDKSPVRAVEKKKKKTGSEKGGKEVNKGSNVRQKNAGGGDGPLRPSKKKRDPQTKKKPTPGNLRQIQKRRTQLP